MKILDGKKLNAKISLQLKSEVEGFLSNGLSAPKLVIFQVGDNAASNIYVGRKIKFAEQISALSEVIKLPESITENELLDLVAQKNDDDSVHGIILQLPVTEKIDSKKIFKSIKSEKDVDGLGESNLAKLIQNDETGIVPATARGVATLLEENSIDVAGKNVVVVGRSILVGKSTALNLINKNATVTICHSHTENLADILSAADIIISATGQSGLIKKDYIKSDHVIVDVGISVVDEKIVGDVEQNLNGNEPAHISPVPGGVGPMTVASLFSNLVDAYKKQNSL